MNSLYQLLAEQSGGVFVGIRSGVCCPVLKILTVDIEINTYKANVREYFPGEFRCYDDKHDQLLTW